MKKEDIQKVFTLRLGRLSNRARVVLQHLRLEEFNSFFNFFIIEKKRIDFSRMRNCGYKSAKELKNLIDTIASFPCEEVPNDVKSLTPFSKQVELLFDRYFDELSTRTKNILSDLGINCLQAFDENLLKNNEIFNIGNSRNCGAKSYQEILNFKEKILQIINPDIQKGENYVLIDKNNVKQPLFNLRHELNFTEKFDALNNRTKNVLQALGANNIQGFYEMFLNESIVVINVKNCGARTLNEIEEFKKEISLIYGLNETEVHLGFFKDIEVYFFEGKVFKQVEIDILFYYYNFVQNKIWFSQEQIANKANLTKERVRQISVRIIDKIKNYLHKIIEKGNNLTDKYFKDDYFLVDKEMTEWINKTENTNFTTAFITYVLQHVNTSSYDFICINEKLQSYSGIFVKKSIRFNFKKCVTFLCQYIDIRRKLDVKIKLDELINVCQNKSNTLFSKSSNLNLLDRMQVLEVLKLIVKSVSDSNNEIELTSDLIIIKRNTKKPKYEFISDILNEYKKPMHFTELYEECLNRNIKVTSALSIHGMMQHYPEIFGLKGQGMYGLKEWGGRFGTIGDVAEEIIKERNQPIDRKELLNILCRELYVSHDSVSTVLFFYEPEKRFIKMKNDKVGLKEWSNKSNENN